MIECMGMIELLKNNSSIDTFVERIYLLGMIIMGIVFSVFFSIGDPQSLIVWGNAMLKCLFEGRFLDYALYLTENNMMTNYNPFQIILLAMALSPIYIINVISSQFGLDLYNHYFLYYKMIIFFITVLTAFLAGRTCIIMEKCLNGNHASDENKQEIRMIFFCSSAIIWIGSFCFGQMDIMESAFMILFAYFFFSDKWLTSACFASLAISVKGFSLLWILPILCLFFSRYRHIFLQYAAIVLSVPIINVLLEYVILKGYHAMKAEAAEHWNHISKLFAFDYANMNICIMTMILVCVFCLYYGIKNDKASDKLIAVSVIPMISFIMFASWYPQYLTCMVFPFIYLLSRIKDKLFENGIWFMMNIGFVLVVFIGGENALDNTMIKNGPLSSMLSEKDTMTTVAGIVANCTDYGMDIGKTLLISALMSILLLTIIKKRHLSMNNISSGIDQTAGIIGTGGVLAIPFLFIIFSFVTFL